MPIGSTNFPSAMDSHTGGSPHGFAAVANQLGTTLDGTITAADTTITVASNTGFAARGILVIAQEAITYTGVSGATQFTGCVRGADGTTAAGHNSGALVRLVPVAANHNDLAAAIVALEDQVRTYGREELLGGLFTLLGDTRALWMPKGSDTTTSLDESLNGRTLTHDASIAARRASLGLAHSVSFNGTAEWTTTPDTANLSFGNGTTDQAMTILALLNVTNTAAARVILSKALLSHLEYSFDVDAADKLTLAIYDNSLGIACARTSDAAITQGAWILVGVTYSGVGGGSAGNGMTLYVNGAVVASTAVNNGTYVAMEDKDAPLQIGRTLTGTGWFPGSVALVSLSQKALTASEMWAVKRLVNDHFNLAL